MGRELLLMAVLWWLVRGQFGVRKKRADYLVLYRVDFAFAAVEAKAAHKNPGDGLQEYAKIPGL
jgi:type I site-specific restriction endonuclease